ncbi:ABC transporter permease [Streptomyces sp. NPDC058872]|uniref:ABC transporter permease n=1 Tax=Streptomyces sp. NPDC058872 TaxID=3346661 RepID=UPI0036D0B5CD
MSGLALKGASWLTVRQYRRTLWLTAAVVALSFLVVAGLRLWDAQTPDSLTADGMRVPANDTGHALLREAMLQGVVGMLLLPLLVGAFVAGPLIAREFESGTHKLSLTQSLSPTAWLRAKLLVTTAAALLATLALMGVFRIGWDRVSGTWNLTWAERGPYESSGVVLVAYVLAAVAVGALIGLLVRRTLVAMATTGLVLGALQLVLGALRWSFLPVETYVKNGPASGLPDDAFLVHTGMLTRDGSRFDPVTCWREAADTTRNVDVPDLWIKTYDGCLARHDVVGEFVDYHPRSHFWPTQLIESGIVLALAGLALYAAFRVLRARHP